MPFRVPLLEPNVLVISPLSIAQTRAVDPPGAATEGYHEDLHEPVVYEDATGKRVSAQRYGEQIRVPCQVEVKSFEELQQVFQGDAPVTKMCFVLHMSDLVLLGLVRDDPGCALHGGLKIKKNDRIDAIEVHGIPGEVAVPLATPLYIYRIDPGSWGMGPSGTDLRIVWTANRPDTPQE